MTHAADMDKVVAAGHMLGA
ncbi:hypothetical protein HaLaN_31751, partial [Haematococcus lacustris]